MTWAARLQPPAALPWSVTDDDDDRQTPATVTSLAPYTICRRASSKIKTIVNFSQP